MHKRLPLDNLDVIIFDLDGTLWDVSECICASWRSVVALHHPQQASDISTEMMRSCMGLPVDEIAQRLLPGLTEQELDDLTAACLAQEHADLRQAGDRLYPGVRETLAELATRYPLAIASNCEQGYIENFIRIAGFEGMFADFECWGATKKSKGENICLLLERNQWQRACLVGDTSMDYDAAVFAQIPFIYARYGFGDSRKFDYAIDNFAELLYWL